MLNNFQQSEDEEEANITITNLNKTSFCRYTCSYHRIYSVVSQTKSFIVKVFPLNLTKEYQKEKYLLQTLDHPNIIKPIGSSERYVIIVPNQLRHEVLVFSNAKYGNFLDYLKSFGKFSEKVTLFYLKQIVRALSYVKAKVGLNHPNLNIENLLMKQDRDVLICGWSNSMKNNEKPLSFVIARMAIQMITGRDPFSQREIKSSHYYKFLTEKHIHKFWTQIEKTISQKYKAFTISQEFKKILSLLLLNQLLNLQEIYQLFDQEQFTLQDVQVELENKEEFKASKWVSQQKKP